MSKLKYLIRWILFGAIAGALVGVLASTQVPEAAKMIVVLAGLIVGGIKGAVHQIRRYGL